MRRQGKKEMVSLNAKKKNISCRQSKNKITRNNIHPKERKKKY
jgi:hypothetical protein